MMIYLVCWQPPSKAARRAAYCGAAPPRDRTLGPPAANEMSTRATTITRGANLGQANIMAGRQMYLAAYGGRVDEVRRLLDQGEPPDVYRDYVSAVPAAAGGRMY